MQEKSCLKLIKVKLGPQKTLADKLLSMLEGNEEFFMIDDQKIVYETALDLANKSTVKDKNVLIVDDSIVRGTTSKEIVQMAKDAGANKVFFTSAAPPVRFPHVYGINMPNRDELIAHNRTISEIADKLEIDNLVYQSVESLRKSIIGDSPIKGLEMSCFTGDYVTGTVNQEYLNWVENEYKS